MSNDLPPRRYFPVDVPHRMPGRQPELGAAGVGHECIEIDTELPAYLEAKKRAARTVPWSGYAGAHRDEQTVLDELRRLVARARPEWAPELAAAESLDEVVRRIQEDVVVMRRASGDTDADRATAVYLNVCFPTGWCPPCMTDRNFLQIHGPVPVLHDFAGERGGWARYLFDTTGGATVRFVWTLTPDDALDRRRCVKHAHVTAPSTAWQDATAAYLRVERQVLVPVTRTLGLFLIRIYRRPVAKLAPDERKRLAESLAGMETTLARYKGFAGHEETILRLLV